MTDQELIEGLNALADGFNDHATAYCCVECDAAIEHATILRSAASRIAEGARDTERLDWLQKVLHDDDAQPIPSIGDVFLWGSWKHITLDVPSRPNVQGETLREAIDAASRPPDADDGQENPDV